jgi:hypothetical protein
MFRRIAALAAVAALSAAPAQAETKEQQALRIGRATSGHPDVQLLRVERFRSGTRRYWLYATWRDDRSQCKYLSQPEVTIHRHGNITWSGFGQVRCSPLF